jgi:hypothetical protein
MHLWIKNLKVRGACKGIVGVNNKYYLFYLCTERCIR